MQITQLLSRLHVGDPDAMHQVIPLVYDELKKLAKAHLRHEMISIRLQPTALVHEAFLRLAGGRHPAYQNRSHFYGVASRLMRQVLVDTARARRTIKRGAGLELAVADLPDRRRWQNRSVLAMEDALCGLEKIDSLKARLIEMRFFAGMTADECSTELSIPVHTVRRELRLARAWLRKEISGAAQSSSTQPCPQASAFQGA